MVAGCDTGGWDDCSGGWNENGESPYNPPPGGEGGSRERSCEASLDSPMEAALLKKFAGAVSGRPANESGRRRGRSRWVECGWMLLGLDRSLDSAGWSETLETREERGGRRDPPDVLGLPEDVFGRDEEIPNEVVGREETAGRKQPSDPAEVKGRKDSLDRKESMGRKECCSCPKERKESMSGESRKEWFPTP